jgi:DNA-directed RNA polymerase I, II, and III subunit RPABC2
MPPKKTLLNDSDSNDDLLYNVNDTENQDDEKPSLINNGDGESNINNQKLDDEKSDDVESDDGKLDNGKSDDDEQFEDSVDENDDKLEYQDVGTDAKTDCLYKNVNNNSDDDDDDVDEIFDDELESENISIRVSNEERITKPIMTKYERVRLLGIRTKQIALGAKPMIKKSEGLTSKEIANLELTNNVIPLIIVRPLPNGRKEYWKVSELIH